MILSKQWLSTRVDLSGISDVELAHALTHAGFEVEAIRPLVAVKKVVVGKVLTCVPHPDSDHLSLTQVDVGDEVLAIVCGASNVRAKQTVIVAKVGAQLPALTIKATTVRGQPSFGMLCSYKELGLEEKFIPMDQCEGIATLPDNLVCGMDIVEAMGWDDTIFDISLTPNRANANSLIAMAREVSGILNRELLTVEHELIAYDVDATPLSITSTTSGCTQFCGRIIESVTIAPSPLWLKNRLMAYNIRSVNNVVDISNLVMLETGHPLHFYDRSLLNDDCLGAADGFNGAYTALDELTYTLNEDDVIIVSNEQIVGLGGIIGGENSKIHPTTTSIVIEVAQFDPMRIKATMKRLGIASEAGQRFSKFIDPMTTLATMERATYYLKRYANAQGIHPIVACAPLAHHHPHTITLSLDFINAYLGTSFGIDRVYDVLTRLHFEPSEENGSFTCTIPSQRDDIKIKEDVVEDIIRFIGYAMIPSTPLNLVQTQGKLDSAQSMKRHLQHLLSGLGLHEIITYTLTHAKNNDGPMASDQPLRILSPLSEERQMIRTHLFASTLMHMSHAQSYKNPLNTFEISHVYDQTGMRSRLSIALSVPLFTNPIMQESIGAHVFTLKGIIENVLSHLGINQSRLSVSAMDTTQTWLHPYQSAWMCVDRKPIGFFGAIHPQCGKAYEVKNGVVAELDLTTVLALKKGKVAFETMSKLQTLTKDMAFVVDNSLPSGDLIQTILKAGKPVLANAHVFDVFTLNESKKSLAITLTFKNNKTYTQGEVDDVMAKVLEACTKAHQASLRT